MMATINLVSNTGNKSNATVVLHNGRSVHPDLFERIRNQVVERIPLLQPNTKYTLSKICGEEFWDGLSRGEKTRAGWCMEHISAMKELPLVFIEKSVENANLYQLL